MQAVSRPRLARIADHGSERARDAAAPWRAWEKTAEWQRLRWEILIRDDFVCRICGAEHAMTAECRLLKSIGRADLVKGKAPDRIADHRTPHKGDETLFRDRDNLQCLCKGCHDRVKQAEDRRREGGVDPDHPPRL